MQQRALRFATLVLGLWAGARATYLAMKTPEDITIGAVTEAESPVSVQGVPGAVVVSFVGKTSERRIIRIRHAAPGKTTFSSFQKAIGALEASSRPESIATPDFELSVGWTRPMEQTNTISSGEPTLVPKPEQTFRPVRLAGSAWIFARGGPGMTGLADNGQLGGSQAGMRVKFPILGIARKVRLAANLRLSSPLLQSSGKEMAAGVSVSSGKSLPVEVIAERRIAMDRGGRNAFALTVVAGLNDRPLLMGWALSAYGQAGLVGLRARNGFADGALRIERPLEGALNTRFGLGLWAAEQPGISRIDVGPRISRRIAVGPSVLVIAAEWRQRISGNAAPGSGPAFVIGSDF